jgi:hypothetical protein
MITAFLKLEPRRRFTSIVILLAGLSTALVIYLTAPLDDSLSWDPADSKQYLRQMESVGCKGNELATNVRLWFASLWHGERLAVTVVVLTMLVMVVYLAGSRPRPAEAGTLIDLEQKANRRSQ